MQCESCGSAISSKMKAALRLNTCPYCAGEIMPKLKSEQYINLLDVLEATTFTTKLEVDVQIREKVANLLVSNFVFKKLENPTREPDLIKVDDEPVVEAKVQQAITTPSLPKSKPALEETKVETKMASREDSALASPVEEPLEKLPARQLKGSKKTNYKQEPQKELSMKDFLKASEETYQDDDSYEDSFDGLSPEEIKRFFPTLSSDEIVGIAASESKATGRGIKRL